MANGVGLAVGVIVGLNVCFGVLVAVVDGDAIIIGVVAVGV
jgi:hypothetical protein